MSANVLGWILIIVGLITTLSGITGGILIMLRDLQEGKEKGDITLTGITEFINALTGFLNALIKAPVWLAISIIGFLLIVWGASLL